MSFNLTGFCLRFNKVQCDAAFPTGHIFDKRAIVLLYLLVVCRDGEKLCSFSHAQMVMPYHHLPVMIGRFDNTIFAAFLRRDVSPYDLHLNAAFEEGSLQVFHRGKDLVLGVQVKVTDEQHSLMFDDKLVELATEFKSQRLEGVWWLPSHKAEIRLALSNTTDSALTATINAYGTAPKQKEPLVLTLASHETRIMDVQRDVAGKKGGVLAEAGGVSIGHSGQPGALLARGFIEEPAIGYSSFIKFSDPLKAKSSKLQGAGLRISDVAGEELTPVAVARNIGSSASVVSGRIPYTLNDGSTGAVSLPEMLLAPGEAKVIDLARAVKASGIRQNVATAGAEFEYSTEPGSVMMSALSVSRDGNQVFNVPLWDIAAQRSSTGGYPWSIDGDSSTVVYIKNVTDSPQKFTLDLDFGDGGSSGVYATGMRTVEAHQTVALDVRELRDNQVPDTAGRTIPFAATHGQIRWSMHGTKNLVLIGRVEQVDVAKGIASSYACQNCCPSSHNDEWMAPGEVSIFEGETSQLTPMQNDRSCYGYISAPYAVGFANWTTSDETIAWPAYQGLATGVSAGTATIGASWTADSWFMGLNQQCEYTPLNVIAEALANILAVKFIDAALVDTSRTASFDASVTGSYNSTLNVNTTTGPDACGGDRFTIKVRFELPFNSASCCNSSSTDNFVTLSDDNKFEFAPSPIDDIKYAFFGNDRPAHVLIYLRRKRDGSGTTNRVNISVAGTRTNGDPYAGKGFVRLVCQ